MVTSSYFQCHTCRHLAFIFDAKDRVSHILLRWQLMKPIWQSNVGFLFVLFCCILTDFFSGNKPCQHRQNVSLWVPAKIFENMWQQARCVHICEWNTARQGYLRNMTNLGVKITKYKYETIGILWTLFQETENVPVLSPSAVYVCLKRKSRNKEIMPTLYKNAPLSPLTPQLFAHLPFRKIQFIYKSPCLLF